MCALRYRSGKGCRRSVLGWHRPCATSRVRSNSRSSASVLVCLVCIVHLAGIRSGAADFYVDQSNPAAADSNPGTAGSPWKTIGKANATLSAGDQVFIKAGKYNQGIAPSASGTGGSPIIYRNFGSDTVTVSGAIVGVTFNQRNWIIVSGLNFSNVTAFGVLSSANNNIVSNCNFTTQLGSTYWSGFAMYVSSQSNLLTGCSFSKWGSPDFGDMVDIGDDTNPADHSFYNRIENCTLFSAGHSLVNFRCGRNIIRGSRLHNEPWLPDGSGQRCIISDTSTNTVLGGFNLIESNIISYASNASDGNGGAGIDLRTRYNIVRGNYFYNNLDCGLFMDGGSGAGDQAIANHIYNNTFYANSLGYLTNTGAFTGAAMGFQVYGSPFQVLSNSIINNILVQSPLEPFWFSGVSASAQFFASNFTVGDPLFVNVTNAYNPISVGLPDLSLKTNSPCIDAGTFLTRVTSTSGSGTSFAVADPYFFQSGSGGIPGDWVQLQGQTNPAQITAINGMTLVLNKSVTWTNGQGVSLPFSGKAPDIGAFAYTPPNLIRPDPPTNLHVVPPL